MIKLIGLLLFCLSHSAFASQDAALASVDALKKALEQFNPSEALNGFTETPAESLLKPQENDDGLKNQGIAAMQENEEANYLYMNEKTRTKAIVNRESTEMQYAKQLIEGSESVKEGGCIASAPKCSEEVSTETCEDIAHYAPKSCESKLQVRLNSKLHTVHRQVIGLRVQKPFDLAHCGDSMRLGCQTLDEVHLSPDCQSVTVTALWNGKAIDISHTQTCADLTVAILGLIRASQAEIELIVVERVLEDIWDNASCETLAQHVESHTCILEKSNPCFEPNATKVIDDIAVKRACWGSAMHYQCLESRESSCQVLLDKGCKQTMSTCATQDFGVCTRYTQTFDCVVSTCIPQPDICTPSLFCANGECDETLSEESHDMGEGVSRLGALIGVASDVTSQQIDEKDAKIFAGEVMKCESYPLNARDCCTDSGWGDWVIHCPPEMQALQKAKRENRVVYLGQYDDWILDSRTQYVHCIFPSILASILQIEGRNAQLGLSFGDAEHPNCGGITPLQLEHIDFARLNLSPLEKDLIARYQRPDLNASLQAQQAHIEQLNQEGRAHD